MPASANSNKTYDVRTIREDLQDAMVSISPTETPFMSAIGTKSASNTFFEWPVVNLAAPSSANRVIEGENDPGNDAPTNALRLGNYTQLSDKVVEVSSTAEAVNGAADAQTLAKQIAYKLKELKRDMETMLLDNVAANAGAAATARATAGLPAFLRTNVSRGGGSPAGANGTLSGTTNGFPNAAATDAGTTRELTEALLRGVIANCWTNGAEPSIVMVGAGSKQKISTAFTGTATKFKNVDDKKIVAAVDLYVSDFGELQVVPNRWQRTRDVFVLDPSYARIAYLQRTKQEPLAKTGHAERRLISVEYGLQVDNEAAHGIIADINPAL